MENKKAQNAIKDVLLTRQNYLVMQGNDLAKAFGGLKSFEQRVLDYCFSFVKKGDKQEQTYEASTIEIIHHFGLKPSGDSYKRIIKAFKVLNENTSLCLPIVDSSGNKGIRMTQLFSLIDFYTTGVVKFEFSKYAAPLVFDLADNYYSFHLSELSQIKGKYGLILLKLWEANRNGNAVLTQVDGSVEEWQSWFLGKDKRVSASRFYSNVLKRACEELETKLNVDMVLTHHKKGRKTTGYLLEITDKRKLINE